QSPYTSHSPTSPNASKSNQQPFAATYTRRTLPSLTLGPASHRGGGRPRSRRGRNSARRRRGTGRSDPKDEARPGCWAGSVVSRSGQFHGAVVGQLLGSTRGDLDPCAP